MMCHRSPLTVQGRSPLLLLLFFNVLSSLFSHTHTFTLLFTPLPHFFRHCSFLHLTSLIPLSLSQSLCVSASLAHCLPRLSSFFSPSLYFALSLAIIHLSGPPLFIQSICSFFISSRSHLLFLPVFISSFFGLFFSPLASLSGGSGPCYILYPLLFQEIISAIHLFCFWYKFSPLI